MLQENYAGGPEERHPLVLWKQQDMKKLNSVYSKEDSYIKTNNK